LRFSPFQEGGEVEEPEKSLAFGNSGAGLFYFPGTHRRGVKNGRKLPDSKDKK